MEIFERHIEGIRKRFQHPLPGRKAQLKMASKKRLNEGIFEHPPENARLAGVLLLLYPLDGRDHIAFIRRIEYDGVHSGQISFPGGEREPGDRTNIDTALREAREETGIQPEKVTILGELTDLYIPPSNFLVAPIVGYTLERPDFKADPSEVQEILEIELDRLKNAGNIKEMRIEIGHDYVIYAPAYVIDGIIIWGATAMILSEFLEML